MVRTSRSSSPLRSPRLCHVGQTGIGAAPAGPAAANDPSSMVARTSALPGCPTHSRRLRTCLVHGGPLVPPMRRTQKARKRNVSGPSKWWRGQDLNLRPSGYETSSSVSRHPWQMGYTPAHSRFLVDRESPLFTVVYRDAGTWLVHGSAPLCHHSAWRMPRSRRRGRAPRHSSMPPRVPLERGISSQTARRPSGPTTLEASGIMECCGLGRYRSPTQRSASRLSALKCAATDSWESLSLARS